MSDHPRNPVGKHAAENTILRFSARGLPLLPSQMIPMSADRGEQQTSGASDNEPFKVRYVNSLERQNSAHELVEKLYQKQGYKTTATAEQSPEHYRQRIGLLIYDHSDAVVATVTLGVSDHATLYADELYRQELDALRAQGVRLVELTKLAIDRHRGNSKRLLATLLNMAYMHCRLLGGTHAVIEATPKHAEFYETSMGFGRAGPPRLCPRVNTMGVLLVIDLNDMQAQIDLYGGAANASADGAAKSFYRYFLSASDQAQLMARLSGGAA